MKKIILICGIALSCFFISMPTFAGTRYGEDGGCEETGGSGGIGSITITCGGTVINNCSRSRESWVCGNVIYNPDGSKKLIPKEEKTRE